MSVTGTNQTKNTVSPTNQSFGGFFLLQETGDYLQQETADYIILDLSSYGESGTNQSKNTVSPTNQAKS